MRPFSMNISTINKRLNQKLNNNQNNNTKDDSLVLNFLTGASRALKNEIKYDNDIKNNEYFFLSELREKLSKIKTHNDLINLANEYNVNSKALDGLIKKKIIVPYESCNSYTERCKLGFVSSLKSNETHFLKELGASRVLEGSQNFEALKIKHGINDKTLSKLKGRGHVFILTEREAQWVNESKKLDNVKDYSISKNRAVEILENYKTEVDCVKIKLSDIKISNYVVNYSEDYSKTIQRINSPLGYIPKKHNSALLDHLKVMNNEGVSSKRTFDKLLEFKLSNNSISQQEIADLVAFSISNSPEEFLGKYKYNTMKDIFPNGLNYDQLKDLTLKPNESLFLFELNLRSISTPDELTKLLDKYKLHPSMLDSFEHKGLICRISDSYKEDLLNKLSPFLSNVSSSKLTKDSELFERLRVSMGLSLNDLYSAQKLGIADIVSDNELAWIKSGEGRDGAKDFSISKARADFLLSSSSFEQLKNGETVFVINKFSETSPVYLVNYKECDEYILLCALGSDKLFNLNSENESLILLKGNTEGLASLSNREKLIYLTSISNNKSISLQDYSDILAYRLNDLYEDQFSSSRLNYIKECSEILENKHTRELHLATQKHAQNLPSNEVLFFLGKLKEFEFSGISESQLLALLLQHNLTTKDFEKLKDNGVVEFSSNDLLRQIQIDKGFLNVISTREKGFITEAINSNVCSDTMEFCKIKDRYEITDKDISRLEKMRRLFVLKTDEIHDFKKYRTLENWVNAGLEKNRFFAIQRHMKKFDGNDNVFVDGFVGDMNGKKLKVNYKEKQSLLVSRFKTPLSYTPTIHPSDHLLKLKSEFIDFSKLSNKEQLRLVELSCSGFTLDTRFILSNDEMIFLKSLSGRKTITIETIDKILKEDFSYKHAEIDLENNIEKITSLLAIPEERLDFLITEKILNLSPLGIENEKGEHVYNISIDGKYLNESEIIKNSRYYFTGATLEGNTPNSLHGFQKYLTTLSKSNDINSVEKLKNVFAEKNTNKTTSKMNKSAPFKLIDYNVYMSLKFGKRLTAKEIDRLDTLKLLGRDPQAPHNNKLFTEQPKSFRLKKEQAMVFNKAFVEFYKIKPEHIEFINKFKQVAEEDLIRIGMKEVDLMRFSKGVDSEIFGEKIQLLKAEKIFDESGNALTFYYIQHRGIISGRSILETFYPDTKIYSRPQSKQELLVHDLKVVSCVLNVLNEYEAKGYRALEIKNESAQYSEMKLGKLNSERHNGPSFMDAQIVFELVNNNEARTLGSSGGKGTITVAVEYGNYITQRMQSKIDNASFDVGFVFANQATTTRYNNKIVTDKIVHFRTI